MHRHIHGRMGKQGDCNNLIPLAPTDCKVHNLLACFVCNSLGLNLMYKQQAQEQVESVIIIDLEVFAWHWFRSKCEHVLVLRLFVDTNLTAGYD